MLRSWAVLNLHKSNETVAFEPIRCFYPLINDVPVISEDVTDASADAFRDSVFFFARASLVDGVCDLYRNPVSFGNRAATMLHAFKQESPLPQIASAVGQFLERWN
jgi:hypothetical protein